MALRVLDLLAWVWGLWTLYPVVRYGGAVLLDFSTTSRIMSVRTGEHIDSAVGLTYTGLGGAALVLVEIALVGVALVLSTKPATWPRRISHVVLVLWTVLWLANSIWMESLSGGRHGSVTTLVVAATAVVLVRAVVRWGPSEA